MKKYLFISVVLLMLVGINSYTKNYSKQINLLKAKAINSSYNKSYGILIDYSLQSGKNRMFVIDLKEEKIIYKCLVAHGSGSKAVLGKPSVFSNVSGSNKSSLGFTVIRERGYSNYGIHVKYVLEGISKTTSNVRRRCIVLHSYPTISPVPTFPLPTIESQGCPTVSNRDMRYLNKLLSKNKKILIYSFKNG